MSCISYLKLEMFERSLYPVCNNQVDLAYIWLLLTYRIHRRTAFLIHEVGVVCVCIGGPGTPKESPSLSPLYATPVSLRGEDREDRGGDNTPTSAPTHSAASLNSSAMSGLASRYVT